jgi:hypothetical protein
VTYRSLAAGPLVFVAVTSAIFLAVPASWRDPVLQGEVDVSKLLGLAGTAAAALAFDRGDYLRRGWGAAALNYLCLLGRDATLLAQGHVPPLAYEVTRGVLVTIGNVVLVVGVWILARAWGVAGLEHPGSKAAKAAVVAAAIGVVLVFAGPTFVVDVRDVFGGASMRFDTLGSDLGDLLCLPLVAPVALTALAVQGGTLRWPWTLLTASLLSWLLYDAVYTAPVLLHVVPGGWHQVSEQFHVLAGALACAAGLAQRKAVTDDDDGAPGG